MKCVLNLSSMLPEGSPYKQYSRIVENFILPILKNTYYDDFINISLSLSFSVMQWIESNKVEINMLIKELIKKDRLELSTSVSSSSPLSFLATRERIKSVEETTNIIKKIYKFRAQTFYPYSFVWDINNMSVLSSSGVKNVFIKEKKEVQTASPSPVFTMRDFSNSINIFQIDEGISEYISNLFTGVISTNDATEKIRDVILTKLPESEIVISLDADFAEINSSDLVHVFKTIVGVLKEKECNMVLPSKYGTIENEGFLPSLWYDNDKSSNKYSGFVLSIFENDSYNLMNKRRIILETLYNVADKKVFKFEKNTIDNEILHSSPYPVLFDKYDSLSSRQKISQNFYNALDKFSTSGLQLPLIEYKNRNIYLLKSKFLYAMVDALGAKVVSLQKFPDGWNYCESVGMFCDSLVLGNSKKKSEIISLTDYKYDVDEEHIVGDSIFLSLKENVSDLSIHKLIKIKNSYISNLITIENHGGERNFSYLMNNSFLLDIDDRDFNILNEDLSGAGVKSLKIKDKKRKTDITVSSLMPFSYTKKWTKCNVNKNENFFSVDVFAEWQVKLKKGEKIDILVTIKFDNYNNKVKEEVQNGDS